MNNRSRVTLIYIILGLVFLWWLQSTLSEQQRQISYTTFKEYLDQGKIQEVHVGETKIVGRLKGDHGVQGERFETIRIEEPDLVQRLEERGVQSTGVIEREGFGSILLAWILPVGLMILIWGFIMKRMGKMAQGGVMSFGKNRVKIVGEKDVQVSFDDVAGLDEAKVELQEIVHFLKEPEQYTRIGARIPKGVLLVGPPGTGKTLMARAVAGQASVPFFLMSGSDFVEMFVGLGASRVRDLFQQAQEKAPCIIFIDELDALGKARGAGGMMGGHDEREQTLNQLLVEMDGFDPNKGVVIMAATNRPEVLDPALLRPGRFDRQVLVDRPDLTGREAILRIHADKVRLEADVDLKTVALRTPGFAGADLANAVNEAALLAVRRKKGKVTMDEFEEAIDRVVAGLQKKGRLISEKERKIVAYHEVGHAVVGEVLPHAEKTHKISIVPRGMAALGMTWQRPTEDRYLLTKSELRDRIAALLGGRAAEKIFIGDITTGAQNDLSRATDIARAMVRQYGMSDELGPVAYDPENKAILPTSDFMPSCEHGSMVSDKIDAEVKMVLEEAMVRANKVLTEYRDQVEVVTAKLLEREQIDGDELRALL
ncbi:MAG: ATP-dependent zinc metalloprotease FtsH [Myxococcota bacterium]|nr:ATP-dependent zinc metalloprotease FtsH [Myxococcota bacterium]